MPPENHQAQMLQSDGHMSGDVKESTVSDRESDTTSQAPEGSGIGGYVVSLETQDAIIEFIVDLTSASVPIYRSHWLDPEHYRVCCGHRRWDITATHVSRLVLSNLQKH